MCSYNFSPLPPGHQRQGVGGYLQAEIHLFQFGFAHTNFPLRRYRGRILRNRVRTQNDGYISPLQRQASDLHLFASKVHLSSPQTQLSDASVNLSYRNQMPRVGHHVSQTYAVNLHLAT